MLLFYLTPQHKRRIGQIESNLQGEGKLPESNTHTVPPGFHPDATGAPFLLLPALASHLTSDISIIIIIG